MKQIAALLAVLTAATVAAQQFDNQARGFAPGKPFQMNGIDNVNIFNGNLTVAIPIGQTYHNGALSYGFSLVYSGNVWDAVKSGTVGQTTTIVPNRRSNAGLGWLFSMGRIIPPTDPTNEIYQQDSNINDRVWIYEGSDGHDHVLYPTLHGIGTADGIHTYSRDSTYIRMTKINDTTRYMEFPDGTYHVFKELDQNFGTPWTETVTPGWGIWKLVEMRDRFGNSVGIQYTSDATWAEKWTITDGARTHSAYFKPATSPYTLLFDHVDLAAFAGATATWSITAPYYNVARGPGDNSANGFPSTVLWHVPLVTQITAPTVNGVAAKYQMMLNGAPDYDISGTTTGQLRGIQLPTGGWVEWDYQYITLSGGALPRSRDRAIGAVTRRTLDANRNTTGIWTYGHALSGNNSCSIDSTPQSSPASQLVASVTTPEGTTTVHYFSVYSESDSQCPDDVGDPLMYGLPFSPGVQDAEGRFLSQETRTGTVTLSTGPGQYRVSSGSLLRSTFVKYELEGDSQLQFFATADRNSRVTSTSVVYDADGGCGGVCRTTADKLGFDGFGHFRQLSGGGNFTGDAYRTTFTNYDGALDTGGDWVLDTYTESCVADEPSPRVTAVTSCGALQNPFTVKTQFERSTGFMTGRRSLLLRSGSLHQNDLLATFSHDSLGNIDHEKYYGGDVQPAQLDTVNAFAALTAPKYQIDHTYVFTTGTLTKHQAAYPGAAFFLVDEDYDRWTGAASATRDGAGVQTQLEYDLRDRPTWIKPAAGAYTNFTYTEASGALPPEMLTVQYPNGVTAGTELNRLHSFYDGQGRMTKQQRRMPDGTDATMAMSYTPSGWTSSVSPAESSDPPVHATTYTYDAFGRPISISAPDGHATTISYEENGVPNNGIRSVKRTVSTGRTIQADGSVAETSTSVSQLYDDKGRLRSITENSGPGGAAVKTSYVHDAFDHTVAMCADDQNISCGQVRNFSYDGRGLLSSESHPENGFIIYTYDARGHLLTTRRPSPSRFDANYVYDNMERITRIDARNPNNLGVFQPFKEFTFWDSPNITGHSRAGKMHTALRHNYQGNSDVQVTESYDYDTAGRTNSKTTTVVDPFNSTGPFTQSYAYDDLGEVTTLNYPTCSNCGASTLGSVAPIYANAFVTSVPNFATSIAYAPTGMVKQINHVGAISDIITPDAVGLPRPQQIQFSYDSCSRPGVAQNPSDGQVSSGGSTILTVAATAGSTPPLTYQWLKDGVVMPGQSGTSLNTGPLTATTHYVARIINSCGKTESAVATITVCGPPSITTQPQGATITAGGTWPMSVTAGGCSPFTYAWYRGNTGDISSGVLGTSASFTTPSLTVTTRYWVRVANGSGSIDSTTAVVTVPLPKPGMLTATLTAANEITVTWGASANADHFELSRLVNGSWSTFPVTTTTNPPRFVDSNRAAGTTYVYHVRAVDANGGSASPDTDNELATNMTFTTIQFGRIVFLSDFDQIRTAVNAVLAASGQPALTWSQMLTNSGYGNVASPASGGLVKAAHLLALRYEMDQALAAVGMPRPAYTDVLSSPTPIRAVHLAELQGRAQ